MSSQPPEPSVRLDPVAVEQQLTDDLAAVTDARTAALVAAWVLAWSEVSAELRDSVLEVIADGTRLTSAVLVRSPRLQRALAQIADRLEDLAEDAGITITGDLQGVIDQAVEGQAQLMAAQVDPTDTDRLARLDLGRRPGNPVLDAIVDRFIEQVTADTLPIAEETYEVIQREVTRGIAVGDNPRETAARIVDRVEDHWNFGRTRAETIARTEMVDAYREGARVTQDEHADVLAGWLWLAHFGKGRSPCRSCLAMHGQLFNLDVNGPDDHQQGRCTRCPVVGEDDGSVNLSWVPDVDEFFDSLTPAEQLELLGREGYRAWLRGEFPRSAWTKRRTTDGWRDSMVPASPKDRATTPVTGS